MGQALGQEIRYTNVPPEVYRSFGFPGADDLGRCEVHVELLFENRWVQDQ